MTNENLIPITTTARAREVGSKGGQVRSYKKKFAAKLREAKKKGVTDAQATGLMNMMIDSDFSSYEILEGIRKIENYAIENDKHGLVTAMLNYKIKWHELQHGSKARGPSVQINQQINMVEANREIEVLKKYH